VFLRVLGDIVLELIHERAVFTPLFFGASLHVPSSEDISSPGRLADWVSENGITVTHLTPAMGQLLSSTSANVQIPSLRNAFFVGDILTKRDCLRLQSLAPNCAIINMYGTTETQRAVSYFLIPSLSSDSTFLKVQKDVIPAGKGMVDVQLIVVNRNDRTLQCGIGEVGEIYVRSGGLAEGYLDEEASAEKFIDNWFSKGERHWADTIAHPADGQLPGPESAHWKGIRDRMYRSGDLGRYLPPSSNGNWTSTTCEVECTGRADDQVKIRGFRIELGEIDVWLSQHPFVRENVTLVRRDKFEEKVLVCYFVPKDGKGLEEYVSEVEDEEDVGMGFRKYRKLIRDIREYLKKKLPSYSVPSRELCGRVVMKLTLTNIALPVFVPLNRMPLNPNGKIDKPALPFPDAAVAASLPSAAAAPSAVQTLSATESTIHTIWAKLLPSPPPHIPLDENFFDMGGHSILATRLIFEMRKAFTDIAIPLGVIFEKPTIKGLSSEIERLKSADFGVAGKDEKEKSEKNVPNGDANVYSSDLDVLSPRLASSYHAPPIDFTEKKVAVFLTGATGFLGTFVLRDLLSRPDRVDKVICLVRGKDLDGAKARLNEALKDKGIPVELGHRGLEVVVGDLGEEKFGLSNDVWERVAKECDVVLHNGALVS
jgi:L-aminoadipate-semialdehyde dehydrogenase